MRPVPASGPCATSLSADSRGHLSGGASVGPHSALARPVPRRASFPAARAPPSTSGGSGGPLSGGTGTAWPPATSAAQTPPPPGEQVGREGAAGSSRVGWEGEREESAVSTARPWPQPRSHSTNPPGHHGEKAGQFPETQQRAGPQRRRGGRSVQSGRGPLHPAPGPESLARALGRGQGGALWDCSRGPWVTGRSSERLRSLRSHTAVR